MQLILSMKIQLNIKNVQGENVDLVISGSFGLNSETQDLLTEFSVVTTLTKWRNLLTR